MANIEGSKNNAGNQPKTPDNKGGGKNIKSLFIAGLSLLGAGGALQALPSLAQTKPMENNVAQTNTELNFTKEQERKREVNLAIGEVIRYYTLDYITGSYSAVDDEGNWSVMSPEGEVLARVEYGEDIALITLTNNEFGVGNLVGIVGDLNQRGVTAQIDPYGKTRLIINYNKPSQRDILNNNYQNPELKTPAVEEIGKYNDNETNANIIPKLPLQSLGDITKEGDISSQNNGKDRSLRFEKTKDGETLMIFNSDKKMLEIRDKLIEMNVNVKTYPDLLSTLIISKSKVSEAEMGDIYKINIPIKMPKNTTLNTHTTLTVLKLQYQLKLQE